MHNQIRRLLLLFALLLFLLLISFSFIIYFSTKNSVDYQQQLLSESVINQEVQEHIINNNGNIKIKQSDHTEHKNIPTLYFITDGTRIIKQSEYGHRLIRYIQSHTHRKEYVHHYIAYENRHYHVSSRRVSADNTYYIYTIIDSTESYHALNKLKHMLIGVTFIYLFLIIILAYLLSIFSVKPYKKAIESQRVFVQNASHELKTPISVVKAGLSVLTVYEKDNLTPIGKETITDLNDEIEHMKDLVNQLLLLETVQGYEMTRINLKPLCIEVTQRYQKLLNNKIQLKLTDTYISGNKDAIVQALNILFDNAIKYNDYNVGIQIKLNQGKLIFKDDGAGITDNELKNIFERFYRGKEVGSIEGTGIGLALFKEIMNAHDADVEVFNKKGLQFNILFKK